MNTEFNTSFKRFYNKISVINKIFLYIALSTFSYIIKKNIAT